MHFFDYRRFHYRCGRHRPPEWAWVALVIAGGLAAPATVSTQQRVANGGEGPPSRPGTVAVAPFVNISGQPADDWIGVGIAETVTADLDQIDSFSVIGREAFVETARQQGTDLSPTAAGDVERVARRLGRDLGIAWLVSGGYQRLGNQLRLTARIVDIETGAVSTTVKVDGSVDEIFALQDRIVVELGRGFEPFATEPPGRTARDTALPAGPSVRAVRPTARQPDNGNGGGALRLPSTGASAGRAPRSGAGPPTGAAERGSRSEARAGGRVAPVRAPVAPAREIAPDDVTGGISTGEEAGAPAVGIAAAAGILTGRPTVRPPRAMERPRIDGQLDDAVWRSAVRITEFVQQSPVEGAAATENTDVYIAYDSQNIYFGIHAHYADPGLMRANRLDRDQAFRDDSVSVYFDTFLDQQRAYVFSVNGYGVQGDALLNARGGGGGGGRGRRGGRGGGGGGGGGFDRGGIPVGDNSWDALFDSGGQVVDDGFTAEMAIPFKSLRYPQRDGGAPHRWGFQIVREIRGKDESVVWASMSRGISGFLTQVGVLDGMTGVSTSRNIEVMPTFTAIQFGSLSRSNGDFVNKDTKPEAGVNLKYGLTSNLTADATFNPDFSQIESDQPQIEVNQRFALFYPELRPFFLEGAEIFDVRGPVTFVHTRRIVDPDFGGKITGKIGKTTVGLLVANDGSSGAVADASDPAYGNSAHVLVGRARYDLYSESYLGALVTNRGFLDGYSRVGLIDGSFRLGATQSLGFRAAQADHRDRTGVEGSGQFFESNWRLNGRNWTAFLASYTLSPDFRTDVGFVRRVDQKRVQGRVGYAWWPESWVISWGPNFSIGRNWSFDDVLEDEGASAGITVTFARNISFNADIRRDMERFGGINFDKNGYSFGGQVSASRKYSAGGFFRYGDEVQYSDNPFLGRGGSGSLFMTLRPMSRFQSEINLNASRLIDPRNDDDLVFNVKILRILSTYQLTDRFVLRNITEYNTFDKTVGLNTLVTYRVNAGTVFFVGYDDHHQQADLFDAELFPDTRVYRRTNRAFFTKLQYLFRY